jgi:GNAT superfamily N-acetyltransferase
MTAFEIVPAGPGDMAKIGPLVAEMLAFYKTPMPVEEAELATILEQDGPAGAGAYDCLIAWTQPGEQSKPLGFAMYSTVYEAAFVGNGIFLRDLYVTEEARGKRVGKALMTHLAQICLDQGYRRIDWHADRLDLHARAFYELIAPDSFKLNRLSYRVEGDALTALASIPIE